MNNESVTALAGLFGSTAEEVSQAIEGGSISGIIEGFKQKHKIFTTDDFGRFTENLKAQAISELDKNNLPKPVYDYVKAAVLESKEKVIAKQYGVEGVQGIENLVEEIIKVKTKNQPNEGDTVIQLKKKIVEMESEFNGKLAEAQSAFSKRVIDSEINRVINELPIDAEGEKLNNQREIVRALLNSKFQFNIDGDAVVALKDGKVVQDSKLDPIPLKSVITDFAKAYVNISPDMGGRGDSSSQSQSGKSVNITKYCEEKGIIPNSVEFVTALKDFTAKGFKIEY